MSSSHAFSSCPDFHNLLSNAFEKPVNENEISQNPEMNQKSVSKDFLRDNSQLYLSYLIFSMQR